MIASAAVPAPRLHPHRRVSQRHAQHRDFADRLHPNREAPQEIQAAYTAHVNYESDYAEANPGWHLEDAGDKAADVLTSLRRVGITPSSVADIGCGVGAVLTRLHNELDIRRCVGYDLSEHAIAEARRRAPDNLTFLSVNAADDPEEFEVMLILDVVEHVPDPVHFMRSLQHKAPVAILNVPLELSVIKILSAESLVRGRRALGHVHYFNEALAREMVEEAGYSILDAWISPPGSGRPEVGWRRAMKSTQRLAAAASPGWASRTIGGCSLMMVARSPRA